jgi:SAM-dependent methyltransferase
MSSQSWFENWFRSPYYSLLYKSHNAAEAHFFIDNLLQFLKPGEKAHFLDIPCGRGRHSIYLASKGFDVTGMDLIKENILFAKKFEQPNLTFYEHDMRQLIAGSYYDFVLNLFTSIGYFESPQDNQRAIQNFAAALHIGGKLVIDFFNANTVEDNLEEKNSEENGIRFHVKKEIVGKAIVKRINVMTASENLDFEEHVSLLHLADFERFFSKCGLQLCNVFGDYELKAFDVQVSPRLILIAEKIR